MKNILIFLLFSCFPSQSQVADYKKVPDNLLKKQELFQEFPYKDKNSFIDLTKFLPKNHVTDGSVDYTAILQKAINQSRKVLMPDFPVLINDKSLVVPSNTIIFFQRNSQLVMKSSSKGNDSKKPYYAILLYAVNNVQIFNCSIKGDRNSHIGGPGEWGMGIGILGSSKVTISGGRIVECWGDGIYVGNIKKSSTSYRGYYSPSSSIKIENIFIDNNRRNGVSITSGVNIEIRNSIISNTNGTLPMSGVDIEPNSPLDLIRGIMLFNITTFNNKRDGILLAFTRISSKEKVQNISVEIDGHTDLGSYSPLRIGSGFRKEDKRMAGSINIKNSQWSDNIVGVRYNKGHHLLPRVNFNNNHFNNLKNEMKFSGDKYINTQDVEEILK